MKNINFGTLDNKKLNTIIKEVLEERCLYCGIYMEELFDGYFNIQWVANWIRNAMPLDTHSEDYHYQTIMYGCREEILKKI